MQCFTYCKFTSVCWNPFILQYAIHYRHGLKETCHESNKWAAIADIPSENARCLAVMLMLGFLSYWKQRHADFSSTDFLHACFASWIRGTKARVKQQQCQPIHFFILGYTLIIAIWWENWMVSIWQQISSKQLTRSIYTCIKSLESLVIFFLSI